MIEARDLGGTCLNRGCTPKKVSVAAAHVLDEIERADRYAITVDAPRLDWRALIEREKDIVRDIPSRLSELMPRRGVDVIVGNAAFIRGNTIGVNGRELEAGNIVIATGSKPRSLPIPGAEHLTTSEPRTEYEPGMPRCMWGIETMQGKHSPLRGVPMVGCMQSTKVQKWPPTTRQ